MRPSCSVALSRLRAAGGMGATLALTAALVVVLEPVVAPLLQPARRPLALEDLLVLGCALLLLAAWCRLAIGIVLCLGETLVRVPHHPSRPSRAADPWLRPAAARRCAAIVVGSSVGALVGAPLVWAPVAATADVVTLPAPGRPVGGPVVAPAPAAERAVVVRDGDTLWALASEHLLPPAASDRRVDAAWRHLYAVNRATLGPDPDLIRPGSRLDLPARAPAASTEGHP